MGKRKFGDDELKRIEIFTDRIMSDLIPQNMLSEWESLPPLYIKWTSQMSDTIRDIITQYFDWYEGRLERHKIGTLYTIYAKNEKDALKKFLETYGDMPVKDLEWEIDY